MPALRAPVRRESETTSRTTVTPMPKAGERLVLLAAEDEVVVVEVVLVVGNDCENVEVVEDVVDVVDEVVDVVVRTRTVKGEDAVSADREAISLPDATIVLVPLEAGTVNVQENPPVEDVVCEVQV